MKKFSKSLGDISRELDAQIADNDKHLSRQKTASAVLLSAAARSACVLCRAPFGGAGADLWHRTVPYISCPNCRHLQSLHHPPAGYPYQLPEYSFASVYSTPSEEAYRSRVQRVYKPKLDWMVQALMGDGWTKERIMAANWVELGCGAGFFLSALSDFGVHKFKGIERDSSLVSQVHNRHGAGSVVQSADPVHEAMRANPADIYASFFVFEHVEDLAGLFEEISRLPIGTVMAFSVPTFGMSVFLEGLSGNTFARNLDNAFHTQLFTDESIDYALKAGKLRLVSEWVFGQDAMDLYRALYIDSKPRMSASLFFGQMEKLRRSLDSIQGALDISFLSDARHLLAVRA